MKNECNIINDILPLYIEDMVCSDTADFVREHISKCEKCRNKLEHMKNPSAVEPVEDSFHDEDSIPLKELKKKIHKKKGIIIVFTSLITAVAVLFGTYFIGSGFMKRTDVVLVDYSVSVNGDEITLHTMVPTSMGFIRGYNDSVREGTHNLTFYSTFGGFNSKLGAKHEFKLNLSETDTEIYFYRSNGMYKLVLQKNEDTGEWSRPKN